jgi:hypothetical protein
MKKAENSNIWRKKMIRNENIHRKAASRNWRLKCEEKMA